MEIEIRPIRSEQRAAAWRVLRELRDELSMERFETALDIQSREHQYVLIGAYSGADLLGVMGMRPVHTFARGAHLHVDDLVVTNSSRGAGIGRRLLTYAEAYARGRGLKRVFLDSRPQVIAFYERKGYRRHESVLVKKSLS